MKDYEIAVAVQAVALVWLVVQAWRTDKKSLVAIIVVYVGLTGGIFSGAIPLSLPVSLLVITLFAVVAAVCLLSFGDLWLPLTLMVASGVYYYKHRPTDRVREDFEEQEIVPDTDHDKRINPM